MEEGCWLLTLDGLSPFLGTRGGSDGDARLGRGRAQALAGSHHPVPAHPVPACPLWMPRGGHAEIIGCLPGRGSHRPAGGSSGSNKEQDQGGSNPAAPGAPGPDGFQMQPLASGRSRGALESWPGGVGQLCQDVCRGARRPARSSFCSREGPSALSLIRLRLTPGLLKGKLWLRAPPWAKGAMSSAGLSPVFGGLGSSLVWGDVGGAVPEPGGAGGRHQG